MAPFHTVPPEAVYYIAEIVYADYVDDLIAGSLSLSSLGTVSHSPRRGSRKRPNYISVLVARDPANSTPNPVTALLQTSFRFRDIMILVLSRMTGIPILHGRIKRWAFYHNVRPCCNSSSVNSLERKPWTPAMRAIRIFYSNPSLTTSSVASISVPREYPFPSISCYRALTQNRLALAILKAP